MGRNGGGEIIGGIGRGIGRGGKKFWGWIGARSRVGAVYVPGWWWYSAIGSQRGSRVKRGRHAVKMFGESDVKGSKHTRRDRVPEAVGF